MIVSNSYMGGTLLCRENRFCNCNQSAKPFRKLKIYISWNVLFVFNIQIRHNDFSKKIETWQVLCLDLRCLGLTPLSSFRSYETWRFASSHFRQCHTYQLGYSWSLTLIFLSMTLINRLAWYVGLMSWLSN